MLLSDGLLAHRIAIALDLLGDELARSESDADRMRGLLAMAREDAAALRGARLAPVGGASIGARGPALRVINGGLV